MENKTDEDKKEDTSHFIDIKNYQIALNRILAIAKNNIVKMQPYELIKSNIILFSYEKDEKCPLTSYFLTTIFDGPGDIPNFYKTHNYPLIGDLLKNLLIDIGKGNLKGRLEKLQTGTKIQYIFVV